MPELPEVETVRAGLEDLLKNHPRITRVELKRKDIRFPIPKELPKRLEGETIVAVHRRAKYLLLETPHAILLSHLGMTGSWRIAPPGTEDKHDHCYIELSDGRRLAFRDPRRFGLLDLVEPGREEGHPRLKGLGVEPLDEEKFTADYLFGFSRKRKVPLKAFIMDQRVVVGVGNIYASEALFRAGIKPTRATGRLKAEEAKRLVESIREVLRESIEAGGSSISDYRQASGEEGGFQNRFKVYDRAKEPCPTCRSPIASKVIGGRSTYWCKDCQK